MLKKISKNQQKNELKQANIVNSQSTILKEISCVGVGLHTGNKIKLTIKPAPVDTGIIFKRTDVFGKGASIKAHCSSIVDTRLCTCIGDKEGNTISTVEHIMAAFQALNIDNAFVEVSGPEIPIMDGSSESFVFLIKCAGIKQQEQKRKAIKILKEVSYKNGDCQVSLSPSETKDLVINFDIDFPNTVIGREEISFKLTKESFCNEISQARTFGLMRDIEKLRTMGLAKGGSLDNAILVDGNVIVNEDGLRFDDEFVRHKVLDAVGDLYMIGYPIIGSYNASKSGHFHTAELLKLLLADETAWELVNIDDCEDKEMFFLDNEEDNKVVALA